MTPQDGEEVSQAAKATLSLEIALRMEELHQDDLEPHAAVIALYFADAVPLIGPDKAVQYLLMAGERALTSHAYESAAGYFQEGLGLKEDYPEDLATASLLFGLARAQAATLPRLQIIEVIGSLIRAFDIFSRANAVNNALTVAEYFVRPVPGTPTGIANVIVQALEQAPPESAEAGQLLMRYALVVGTEEGALEEVQGIFDRVVVMARRENNVALEMRTLAARSCVDFYQARWHSALERASHAITIAPPNGALLYYEALAGYFASIAAATLGAREELERHAPQALRAAERLGDRYWLATILWANEIMAYLSGDWQSARHFNDRCLEVGGPDSRCLSTRMMLEFATGHTEQGREYLDRMIALMRSSTSPSSTEYMLLAMGIPAVSRIADVSEYLGQADQAIRAALSSPLTSPFPLLYARVGQALTIVQQTDAQAAAEQYYVLQPMAGTMTLAILVDRLLGLLCVTQGDLDQATSHFGEALAYCSQAAYWPEYAWTCLDYAETLLLRPGRRGHRNRAGNLLDEALFNARSLGMKPLEIRAERLRKQKGAYPDSLSSKEVEVTCLYAGGKEPKDIAAELLVESVTVYSQIRQFKVKTNTPARKEIIEYIRRHGLAPEDAPTFLRPSPG